MATPTTAALVSANVKALMRLTDTTGEQAGAIIGRDKSTISRKIRSGQWTIGEIDALAAYWNLPVSRFFEDPATLFGVEIPNPRCVTAGEAMQQSFTFAAAA